MTGKSLLFLCGESYPVRYGFIEGVFAQRFPRLGWHVSWIMPSRDSSSANRLDTWHGCPMRLVADRRGRHGSPLPTFARDLSHAASDAVAEHHPDAIVVRNDLVMMAVGRRLARSLGVPLIIQLSHLIEETRIAYARQGLYGSRVKNFVVGTVARTLRNRLLRSADLVLPISPEVAAVLAHDGVSRDRLVPLTEAVDTSVDPSVHDARASDLRHSLGLRDASLLVYVGNMSRFRQLEFLFDALLRAAQNVPRLHLLMVGGDERPGDVEWLRMEATKRGVHDLVTFVGHVARHAVPAYVRAADLGLSPFAPNGVLETNSPIKLLEYLAAARPAVGTSIPEQRRVLEASGAGYAVAHDAEAFSRAIVDYFAMAVEDRAAMGRRGRAWVSTHRDYDVLTATASTAIDTIIARSPRRAG